MKVTPTNIPDVWLIEPRVFEDERGFFVETFHRARYAEAGLDLHFVQSNHSRSCRGTLRGLHYQIEHPQGKLCRVTRGQVFDVAVDMRSGSPTFGQATSLVLSDSNPCQLYIPPGFAHGFCVLSDVADFIYDCTDYYDPKLERTVLWNDPQLSIPWPIKDPLLSDKDARGLPFTEAPRYSDLPG